MLVTIRTKRFKNMLSFRFYDIFFILVFSFLSVGLSEKCGVSKLPPPLALAITIFKMRVIFCC